MWPTCWIVSTSRWCAHCGYAKARPRAQQRAELCAACNAYAVKYDRLPDPAVLWRRLHRREEQRREMAVVT